MSWIVETLLRNSVSIRSDGDIASDSFNDLIVIESKIEDLYKNGFLSDMDIYVIHLVADGRPIKNLEKALGKNRLTIHRTFSQICERIAYFLGGYFTDDGFLDNMQHNYRLSEEDMDKLKTHMAGKFKHRLMRTVKNDRQ